MIRKLVKERQAVRPLAGRSGVGDLNRQWSDGPLLDRQGHCWMGSAVVGWAKVRMGRGAYGWVVVRMDGPWCVWMGRGAYGWAVVRVGRRRMGWAVVGWDGPSSDGMGRHRMGWAVIG